MGITIEKMTTWIVGLPEKLNQTYYTLKEALDYQNIQERKEDPPIIRKFYEKLERQKKLHKSCSPTSENSGSEEFSESIREQN